MRYVKYTKEIIEEACKVSKSYADVLKYIGVKTNSGGIYTHIVKRIKKYGIDTSHFDGGLSKKKGILKPRKTPDEILVLNTNKQRTEGRNLKRAILELGVKYECVLCGLSNSYNNRELVLEIDHINGICYDNRLENLRLLCPNCHSQETKENTSKKERDIKVKNKTKKCQTCEVLISNKSSYCRNCNPAPKKQKHKIEWPSNEKLQELVLSKPLVHVGKELGVCDNSVRKRCRKNNIQLPPRDYWLSNGY